MMRALTNWLPAVARSCIYRLLRDARQPGASRMLTIYEAKGQGLVQREDRGTGQAVWIDLLNPSKEEEQWASSPPSPVRSTLSRAS